jgi:hypothetical protein
LRAAWWISLAPRLVPGPIPPAETSPEEPEPHGDTTPVPLGEDPAVGGADHRDPSAVRCSQRGVVVDVDRDDRHAEARRGPLESRLEPVAQVTALPGEHLDTAIGEAPAHGYRHRPAPGDATPASVVFMRPVTAIVLVVLLLVILIAFFIQSVVLGS